ncbi:MAG: hypothetical protein LBG13_00280, partial [Holosporales bacterium]|nr:hypothetical protein [Holosporales bacterium]
MSYTPNSATNNCITKFRDPKPELMQGKKQNAKPPVPQQYGYTSRLATFSALATMKSRRGSTTSPIRIE